MTFAAAVRSIDRNGVTVLWEGKERTIPTGRLHGILLANPPVEAGEGTRLQVRTVRGERIEGRLVPAEEPGVRIRTAAGPVLAVPAARIERIEVVGGSVVHLSDLEPAEVEETPWLGSRTWPHRRDLCVAGTPLRVRGTTYSRGLGTHSRCRLVYDLAGGFRRFRAVLALDDTAPARAAAIVRVLVDGEPGTDERTLRAGEPPIPVDVDVEGARRLTLVVDFGEFGDIGDRVDWCDARLVR
jgi:hypothetical protein